MSRKHLKKYCNLYLFPNLNILIDSFSNLVLSRRDLIFIYVIRRFPKKCLRKNYVEENSVILILIKYERMRGFVTQFRVIEVLWSFEVAVVVRVLHPFSLSSSVGSLHFPSLLQYTPVGFQHYLTGSPLHFAMLYLSSVSLLLFYCCSFLHPLFFFLSVYCKRLYIMFRH